MIRLPVIAYDTVLLNTHPLGWIYVKKNSQLEKTHGVIVMITVIPF
jgi:hypothetical protein